MSYLLIDSIDISRLCWHIFLVNYLSIFSFVGERRELTRGDNLSWFKFSMDSIPFVYRQTIDVAVMVGISTHLVCCRRNISAMTTTTVPTNCVCLEWVGNENDDNCFEGFTVYRISTIKMTTKNMGMLVSVLMWVLCDVSHTHTVSVQRINTTTKQHNSQ